MNTLICSGCDVMQHQTQMMCSISVNSTESYIVMHRGQH